jgi:putative flavoprotein involved in K+ transport
MNRTTSHIDAVIVGAGQAGLAVSYYLRAFGVEHVVFERGQVADSWRSARWDSFTLVTPNWMTRLPGYVMTPGTGGDFLPGDAAVGMLEQFAEGLPVRPGTEVLSVAVGDDGYEVITTSGHFTAHAMVIAGGGQRCPVIPGLASSLAAEIHQSDAGRYRRPDALPPGAVLVVGSGQSGAQIADELATAGRDVLLATSRVPRVPRRYRGRDVHEWTVELGFYDQRTDAVADPAKFREPHPMLSGAHGGHTISYRRLASDGVRLLGRLVDAEGQMLRFGPDLPQNIRHADQSAAQFRRAVDEYVARTGTVAPPPDADPAERALPRFEGSPETLNARAENIGTVIWCTGFGPDVSWLRVPVLAPDGSPAHTGGVTAFPGLYVVGYPWLSNRGSGILYGVAADAARVAQYIAADALGKTGQASVVGRQEAPSASPILPHLPVAGSRA